MNTGTQTVSTTTRRATATAAPPRDWRLSAACQGIDLDILFSDKPTDQTRVLGICRGCPVREICLTDALNYEDDNSKTWGIAGGLTDWQRRALRVEARFGNTPDLMQARRLASPAFAEFMQQWKDWPAHTVAAELRRHGILAAPVTVRVALWWVGGRGSFIPPRNEDDMRSPWMQVRDTCREEWIRLRDAGCGRRDIVAYLAVSQDALERAVTSWHAQTAQEEKAA